MALQGTLDTFELPDVLRLLASTKKTGRLQLRGDRGEGSVWLQDGDVVGVDALGAPGGDAADGLFDLLRAREGGFAFEPGVAPEQPGPAAAVEPLLTATEARLAEWREIEAVVPSLHAWVSLDPELPHAELTIDASTWRLVATIGSGLTVGDLAAALDLPEVPVSRLVRDLVTLGLGVVVDAPPAAAAPEAPVATWEPTVATDAPVADRAAANGHAADAYATNGHAAEAYGTNGHAADAYGTNGHAVDAYGTNGSTTGAHEADAYAANGYEADGYGSTGAAADGYDAGGYGSNGSGAADGYGSNGTGAGDGYGSNGYDVYGHVPTGDDGAAYDAAPAATTDAPAYEPLGADLVDDDADEVARQLAMLSPRAAQAVAAAAAADSDTERDAHLDALEDGEEPINRGLLLKFLSSVKS